MHQFIRRWITPAVLPLAFVLATALALVACSSGTGEESNPRTQTPTPAATNPVPPANSPAQANPQPAPVKVAKPKKVVPAPSVVAGEKGPRLAFKTEELDFGEVQFGDVIEAPFPLTNVGKEPLTITSVQVETVEGC